MNKLIAIHDAEMEHFGTSNKYPNYALMKISAWHKSQGDKVEWFSEIFRHLYDVVYSSKVFDFTPTNEYLPENTVRGGTGYGIYEDLPLHIENMFPDYSIYPECDYAIGFLTRGCPNKCPNCYVPQKEGDIKPYHTWQDIVRQDTDKLVLMDNNVFACAHGIEQMKQLAETKYRIDVNQAMSVFTITPEIADIIAKIKWIKYIRFACDRKAQIQGAYKVAEMLSERGVPNSRLFFYVLITKDLRNNLERIYALRKLGNVTIYGMPYKDQRIGEMPDYWQNIMAQKYIYSGQWRKYDWEEWVETHQSYFTNHSAFPKN